MSTSENNDETTVKENSGYSNYRDDGKATSNKLFIKKCRSGDELIRWVNRTFPGWIHDALDIYDSDLDDYQKNWENVSKRMKCKPAKIVLVQGIVFESDKDADKYSVLTMVQNHLTKYGFCIREKDMFSSCINENCSTALLAEKIRNQLYKKKKCKRPFTNLCLTCMNKVLMTRNK